MKRTAFILLLLACLLPAFGQWHIDEDFEGITTLPAGWTIHDDGVGQIMGAPGQGETTEGAGRLSASVRE